jgi:hypothetical protein
MEVFDMYRKTIGFLLALAVALAMVIDTYILFFKKPAAVESAATGAVRRHRHHQRPPRPNKP